MPERVIREKVIQKRGVDLLRDLGCFCYKMDVMRSRGMPDYMVVNEGRIVFVEFKAPGKKPTPLQTHIHELLETHGAKVFTIDTLDIRAYAPVLQALALKSS